MGTMNGLNLSCNQLLPALLRYILYPLEGLQIYPEISVKRYGRPNCTIKSFVALSSLLIAVYCFTGRKGCAAVPWQVDLNLHGITLKDYVIYILCLFVATVYWHKSQQFVKKIQHNTLTSFIYDFMSCFDDQVMLYHILARFNLQFIKVLHIITSVA